MKIIDTYHDILALAQKTAGRFDENNWKAYAGTISEGLPEKCLRDSEEYDFPQDVLPVLEQALNSQDKLAELHDSFVRATEGLEGRFAAVFGMEVQVDIILYLGLCNGAGWVTWLDGRRVILLGAEKIIELDWGDADTMTALIYHELGHVWHDAAGTMYADTKSVAERSVWQLYQEGIAMYCEQLLVGDFSRYHQNKNGWLCWCEENKKSLFAEYKRRVDAEESTQDFFGDWCNYQGYSDVGYYLGCELVKHMAGQYTITELARLTIGDVNAALCGMAE